MGTVSAVLHCAKDYPALPHHKLDRELLQFDRLDPDVQRRIWEDDTWTWATMIRNPAERLLSGYLDKVVKKSTKAELRPVNASVTMDGSITFEQFIANLSMPVENNNCKENSGMNGLSWCTNPHWRPQIYSCGMSERLDRFDFIGDLHNTADQTRELLSHVGIWESYGKHFINGGKKIGSNSWCHIASHPMNHTPVHVGFQQKDTVSPTSSAAGETAYGHAKGSKDKMERFYTPELLRKVEELYANDYKLWKLMVTSYRKGKNSCLSSQVNVYSKYA